MSSNNLDEKLLLQYITKCFQNWGLTYITADVLKRSKKNDDQAIPPMTRLLFDLSLLHIFDYRHSPQELAIVFQEEEQMMQVIVAHLCEAECPLVVVREEAGKRVVGFDFTSSKHLLIACGWVMAVSNFFNQTVDKLFKRKFENIYKPKPLNFASLSQKYANIIKETNLHHNSDQYSRISYLAKILKNRKYAIECLAEKKAKIIKRLKEDLKCIDAGLSMEDVFSSGNSQQTESLEAELKEALIFEKQNMGFRKYWWIWLDQKIIASQYSDLSTQFEEFERKEVPAESVKYNISIDLHFVGKYLELVEAAEGKLQGIQTRINNLQIKGDKFYKDIQRVISEQLRSAVQQSKSREDETPSFIGMQLQKYMNLQQKKQETTKQSKKNIQRAADKSSRKLQASIKSLISSIDAIVVI